MDRKLGGVFADWAGLPIHGHHQSHSQCAKKRRQRGKGRIPFIGKGAVKGFSLHPGILGNTSHLTGLSYIPERFEKALWRVLNGSIEIMSGDFGIRQSLQK
jgi:hypothetical protein